MITIAVSQYQIELLTDWHSYTAKIEALAIQAKHQGAQLLLLPEYAGSEIVCAQFASDHASYRALQSLIPQYIDFYKDLASRHRLYIVPGSILVEKTPDQYYNRAYFFAPIGKYGFQDKLQLTEFEKQTRVICCGETQSVFHTSLGNIGIAICYDSEFPEIVRALVNAGASLILVPSYTASIAGYNRIFLSCRARAIENQCYVAVSYVVNTVQLSGDIDQTYGQAAVLGPADTDFPDDGIIAQAALMNEVTLLTTSLSLEKLDLVRVQGQVHNFADREHYKITSPHKVNIFSL